jgi:hypothetical protein
MASFFAVDDYTKKKKKQRENIRHFRLEHGARASQELNEPETQQRLVLCTKLRTFK